MTDRVYYLSTIFVLLAVVLLGSLSLHETFSGDQAMFLMYARAMDTGAILYRDVWDIKQPAIFVFYLIAGKLFSFDEVGVHTFELIYFSGLGLVLMLGLRQYFSRPVFALLTPLFTIGIYYTVSATWHLTQVESLVAFPLFVAILAGQKYLEHPERRYLLIVAGVAGGVVALFKLLFVAILLPVWFGLLLFAYFTLGRSLRQTMTAAACLALGPLVPLLLVTLYFAYHNALPELWYTNIVYPYRATTLLDLGDRSEVLKDGLDWFVRSYFPAIALTCTFVAVGVVGLVRDRMRLKTWANGRGNFVTMSLIIWCIAGLGVILLQRLSWWEYHYSLLMVPLGVLAAKGLEGLVNAIARVEARTLRRALATALVIMVVLLVIPTGRRLSNKIRTFNQMELVATGNGELKITGETAAYRRMAEETRVLAFEQPRPTTFVFCNPRYYYISDTLPAISSNGWMPEGFTDVEWNVLDQEMLSKRPKYVLLETTQLEVINQLHPKFLNDLQRDYFVYSSSESLVIYRSNDG